MRQVGDRLIPIGISSGRIHPLQPEDVAGENGESGSSERGSRRSRRRNQNPDLNQYLGQGGFTGQDLEEVCVLCVQVSHHLDNLSSLWSWRRCAYHCLNMKSSSERNARKRKRRREKLQLRQERVRPQRKRHRLQEKLLRQCCPRLRTLLPPGTGLRRLSRGGPRSSYRAVDARVRGRLHQQVR